MHARKHTYSFVCLFFGLGGVSLELTPNPFLSFITHPKKSFPRCATKENKKKNGKKERKRKKRKITFLASRVDPIFFSLSVLPRTKPSHSHTHTFHHTHICFLEGVCTAHYFFYGTGNSFFFVTHTYSIRFGESASL